jgi:hypothetical protein
MSAEAKKLIHEALTLEPAERAEVAAALLDSLAEAQPRDERAWLAEIERRARRAMAGESRGTDWTEARKQVEDRLPR